MRTLCLAVLSTFLFSSLTTQSVFSGEDEPTVPPGQQRGEKAIGGGKLRYWPDRPDLAEVQCASFLGGGGTEWLSGGGFQKDGTVILCGNVLGPRFEMPVKETVLGTDGPPPPEVALPNDKNGKPEKPSWKFDGTTGFIARLSSDLKRVLNVVRLPWNSGAITAVQVDPDGGIFISGRATESIQKITSNAQELAVPINVDPKIKGTCDFTFVARLNPDGTQCEWLRTSKGASEAPRLMLRKDGKLSFGAQQLYVLDSKGSTLSVVEVPGGVRETTSVNPQDGSIVRGGEHHWGTGREPWRCPVLDTYNPDGTFQYQLYNWGGPFVGLDNCRQVSDSVVRSVTHDMNGNILLYAWSDGGNSVMTTQPMDVRRGMAKNGLGLTTAGAGVLSCAYLVRLDPKDFQTIGWTLWLSFYKGKPNSTTINCLAQAADESICFAGSSAWGLVQTSNKLANGEPAGEYLAILNPDMSGVRMSSAMPGCGRAVIGNNNNGWGIATGVVEGHTKVLFMTGASKDEDVYELTTATPIKNAVQTQFGGGVCDGYFVLLDLGKYEAPTPANNAPIASAISRLSYKREARSKGGKQSSNTNDQPEGTVYHLTPDYPKWVTVDAEVRDARNAYWPNFMSGKPVSGQLTYIAAGPKVDSIHVSCPTLCQNKGDQSRRVLGELIKDGELKLEFTLNTLSAPKKEEFSELDRNQKPQLKEVEYSEGKAVLELGNKKIEVTPQCVVRYGKVVEKNINKVSINAYFTVKGRELGLTGGLGEEEIDFRIGMQGMDSPGVEVKKQKK